MTILAIDHGDRRLGLALSDSAGRFAGPLPTLERAGPHEDVTPRLRALCDQHAVDRIVVGLPLNMDGSRGPRAQAAQDFADRLREALGIEVVTWDERLTTAQAERAMLQADLSRKKRKKRRDRLAAQLLLQNYLDAHPPSS